MKKKIINIIRLIVIFSIGVTCGKMLNWGYFELDKSISIIDSFTLFITIGMAIYVAKILEKEVQDLRIEKELYIAKISDLESILNSFEVLIEDDNVLYNKINNRIHSCRIKKKSIFDSVKDDLKNLQIPEMNSLELEISDKINLLKRLLTETSVAPTSTPELSVRNGIAQYSINRAIEINTEINAINERLFKMKIQINSL